MKYFFLILILIFLIFFLQFSFCQEYANKETNQNENENQNENQNQNQNQNEQTKPQPIIALTGEDLEKFIQSYEVASIIFFSPYQKDIEKFQETIFRAAYLLQNISKVKFGVINCYEFDYYCDDYTESFPTIKTYKNGKFYQDFEQQINISELVFYFTKVDFPLIYRIESFQEMVEFQQNLTFSGIFLFDNEPDEEKPSLYIFSQKEISSMKDSGFPFGIFVFDQDENDEFFRSLKKLAKSFQSKMKFFYLQNDHLEFNYFTEFFQISKLPSFTIFSSNLLEFYRMDSEFSINSLTSFINDFFQGNLETTTKSEPILESNEEPIKKVVYSNWNEMINLNEKDIILFVYTSLNNFSESKEFDHIYQILQEFAQKIQENENLIVAKIDGLRNTILDSKINHQIPAIWLLKKNDKSNPILYQKIDLTVKSLTEFYLENVEGKSNQKKKKINRNKNQKRLKKKPKKNDQEKDEL
ncbi:protein disulfide-isomerase a3 [Anaeramoeba ignava]|uniref:protein disulfide-isomerase n=1 Tax=Anaeramoeba ignava TaxID=1746090 RepID=A0A9Q0LUL8_ANAIG|nr:protein disulfide-isomerase a3 [Anaeramoeba ignava]